MHSNVSIRTVDGQSKAVASEGVSVVTVFLW